MGPRHRAAVAKVAGLTGFAGFAGVGDITGIAGFAGFETLETFGGLLIYLFPPNRPSIILTESILKVKLKLLVVMRLHPPREAFPRGTR